MKNTILAITLFLFSCLANAQGGKWTWMHGTNLPNDAGNYGIKGVAAATNMPPGRYQAAYWTDLDGNFWLFGGTIAINNGGGFNSVGNDMWKYDVGTNLWTWVSGEQYLNNSLGTPGTIGVPSINNCPNARGYGTACWTDKNNNLWLYGGSGSADDLWKYNISTNEWTMVKGSISTFATVFGTTGVASPLNSPGAMQEIKSGWVNVNNELWMFGGYTSNIGGLVSDLWRYSIATNQWTHMKGPGTNNVVGVYGTMGVEAASNMPGSRWSYTKWRDIDDNFYIFAGGDHNTDFNDVWKYNQVTNNWTWISGTNLVNDLGGNPAKCTQNLDKFPEARVENQTVSTVGCTQAFWSFGGISTQSQFLNDLWLFNAADNKWTYVSGDLQITSLGVYGTKGVSAPANIPPGKMGLCIWTDKDNNVWVFGGHSDAWSTVTNDLWKFEPDTACFKTALSANFNLTRPTDTVFCGNQSITMDLLKIKNLKITPNTNISFNADSSKLTFTLPNTTTFTLTAEDDGICPGKDTMVFTITKLPNPIADFTFSPDITSIENPVFQFTNTSSNAVKYEWYYENTIFSTQTNESKTFNSNGKYCITLVAFNSEGCTDTVTKCGEIVPSLSVTIPNSFTPNGDNQNDKFKAIYKNLTVCKFQIFDRFGNKVFSTTDPAIGWDGTLNNLKCDVGTYYYSFEYENFYKKKKLLKGDLSLLR